jgi:ABC-type nitrate/sulfonate/bicarbonate transport system permease component
MATNLKMPILQGAVILAFLLLWALGDAAQVFNPAVLPPITNVAAAFIEVWSRPEFLPALVATASDSVKGVIAASVLAIPLGILIGMFPAFERASRTLLDFGRSFPVVALLPIFVLLIGSNSLMKTVSIAIACFFPILLQTIYGARRLEPTIVDTVRSYRIPMGLRFVKVLLPAAAPFIATGIRMAISISVLVAVGTEIIIQMPGLGTLINLARIYNEVSIAFAYVIYAGLLGVVLTMIWDAIENRLLRWHRQSEQA